MAAEPKRSLETFKRQLPDRLSSPKLTSKHRRSGYPFYAGFSEQFVSELIQTTSEPGAMVLDPWMGSGTTVRVATEMRLNARGIDINPAMVVIAKAGLLGKDELVNAEQAIERLLAARDREFDVSPDDPLNSWFDASSAALIRQLQQSIAPAMGMPWEGVQLTTLTRLEAHQYAALFLAVRSVLRKFIGTNPTWVRTTKSESELISIKPPDFAAELLTNASKLRANASLRVVAQIDAEVALGASADIESRERATDLIITSPPYCTRLDYAVATRPELAVLGMPICAQRDLRRSMLGTTTVPRSIVVTPQLVGTVAFDALTQVACHPAKASKTYYWKWLAEYFTEYARSLAALARVMDLDGMIVLVVQDSYYKQIRIDLAEVSIELLNGHSWSLIKRYAFPVSNTMASFNSASKRYGVKHESCEEVLCFAYTKD